MIFLNYEQRIRSNPREDRWNNAFSDDVERANDGHKACIDRKAIIVIEHLIQASDVSHTKQPLAHLHQVECDFSVQGLQGSGKGRFN